MVCLCVVCGRVVEVLGPTPGLTPAQRERETFVNVGERGPGPVRLFYCIHNKYWIVKPFPCIQIISLLFCDSRCWGFEGV